MAGRRDSAAHTRTHTHAHTHTHTHAHTHTHTGRDAPLLSFVGRRACCEGRVAVRSRGEAAVRVSRCDGLACRVILPRLCCRPSLGTPPHVHRVGAVRWLSANGSAGVETHPAQLDIAAHLFEGLHWIRSGAWLQDDKIAVLDTGRADGSRHVLITCQQQHGRFSFRMSAFWLLDQRQQQRSSTRGALTDAVLRKLPRFAVSLSQVSQAATKGRG